MIRRPGRAVPALLLLLSACAGYRMMDPEVGRGRAIAVPPARNDSDWIGLEVPLTRALREDVQRLLDLRLDSEAPELVLETSLVDPERRGRVGLRGGAYALASAAVEVDWKLSRRGGGVLASGRETRELEFVTALEENARGTYEQIFRSMSEKIALDVAAALAAADARREASSR